jgi:hypothetical protein
MKWREGKLCLGVRKISKQEELLSDHLMEEGNEEPPTRHLGLEAQQDSGRLLSREHLY